MRSTPISHEGVDLRGIVVDDHTPWLEDYTARALVVMHPGGMTFGEIAAVIRGTTANAKRKDVSVEAVRLVLSRALRKLRRCDDARELLDILAERDRHRRDPLESAPPDPGGYWESPQARAAQIAGNAKARSQRKVQRRQAEREAARAHVAPVCASGAQSDGA